MLLHDYMIGEVLDLLDRPLRSLRLSVTDRCNLRCEYCMPEDEYAWLPKEDLLSFEETTELVGVFLRTGVHRIRLTGGEPLLRRNLGILVRMIAAQPGLEDFALTTNGVLLEEQAHFLKAAGLHRLTVSLDTNRRDRFRALTRSDAFDNVKAGIAAAAREFGTLKIDAVVIRGINDDELSELIEFGRTVPAEVRFIEYMDVGGATRWHPDRVISMNEMLDRLRRRYGNIQPISERAAAPAARFALPDGTTFGIIASTTAPFCRDCDRSRLTADGVWYLCLYATKGTDLRAALRGGASGEEIQRLIAGRWMTRDDRGAERRLAVAERRDFVPLAALRKDPHLEMHTRGG